MGLPLILAGVSVGAQAAKGIQKNTLAKRRLKMARAGLGQAEALQKEAWAGRTNFDPSKLYASMDQQRAALMNQANSNTAGQAIMNRSDARLSNLASQTKRVSSTTGQAQAGLLAGIKAEQEAANEASQAGIDDRTRSMQLLLGLNQQQAGLEDKAYQYNVQDPFNLKYAQAIGDRNAYLNLREDAYNQKASAFGDFMNAISSAAGAGIEGLGGLGSDSWLSRIGAGNGATQTLPQPSPQPSPQGQIVGGPRFRRNPFTD